MEKLILAFGLNNRCQRNSQIAVSEMTHGEKKFPGVEIFIPLINFSTSLFINKQKVLQALNDKLWRHKTHIPLLEESFEVSDDCIHWTELTAARIFTHWGKYLN